MTKLSLVVIPLIALAILLPLTANGRLLTIKFPDSNATVPANKFIVVNGTSAASNATHTDCNVMLQINQNGYMPVTPKGPNGTYTNWTTLTDQMMKIGHNEIEAQLHCYPPGTTGNITTVTQIPNLIKHLTHNVTGTTPSAHGINIMNSTG